MSRVSFVAVCVTAVIALGACGSDGGTPEGAATPSRQPSPSQTPRPTPAPEPPSASATETPTPRSTPTRSGKRHKTGVLAPLARPSTVEAHLLDADRLPSVGGRAWQVGSAEHRGAVGACQKTELETIGAVETVSRRFTAGNGRAAVQVVGRFADTKTAWRAHQVLIAWREDCEQRVPDSTVGPLRSVVVRTGDAASYLSSFRSRAAGLAILRTGAYLSVVEVATGREAYPTDRDPARVAVRRIARTF